MSTDNMFRLLRTALFLSWGMLLWNGCSEPQEDVNVPEEKPVEVEPEPKPEVWEVKVLVTSPQLESELITPMLPDHQIDTRFDSHWNEAPDLSIWAKQGNELFYIDRVGATQLTENSLKALFEFKISNKLDFEKPFDIYGLEDGKQVSTNLYYKNKLKRGSSFGIYFKASGKQGEVALMGGIAGVAETLFFINKTDKPVQVKHKGFSADKLWYYTYADVSLDDGTVINAEQGEEVISKAFSFQPFTGNNAGEITSYYAPSENKITDAQLILEIDGKEVRSANRLNSDVTLQFNHSYGIIVTWDGSELRFAEDPGIIAVSRSDIDFGAVEYGTSKTETFTVSNTGGAPISCIVSIEDCVSFDVSDKEKEFILDKGESKEYTVTAFGLKRNSAAYCDFQVYTNAGNGKQVVRVKSSGWDTMPLTLEKTELTLSVGDVKRVNLVFGGLDCELTNNRPDVVNAGLETMTVSGGEGMLGGSSHSFLSISIQAIAAGTASVIVTDKETNERAKLIVNVIGENTEVVPDAVDMGLPSGTKWAPYNIGASNPQEVGDFFAWGETDPKKDFSWSTYVLADGEEGTCYNIGNDISGTKYDAALSKWGDNWRMPTLEQIKELFFNCNLSWESEGRVSGVEITSRINGNSIFLPVSGACFGTGIYYTDECVYWSSTLSDADDSYAYRFMVTVSKTSHTAGWGYARDIERCFGFPVRPVYVSF